jgi:hypothetical protein
MTPTTSELFRHGVHKERTSQGKASFDQTAKGRQDLLIDPDACSGVRIIEHPQQAPESSKAKDE